MTRCHLCDRPCVYEVEPAFGEHLPAVLEDDVWLVVARNKILFEVCERCWGLWPDDWKIFPPVGFGRVAKGLGQTVRLDDFIDLLAGPR